MKNEVFYPNDPSDKLSLPVAADTAAGLPVVVGSIIGVTATAEGKGGNVDGNATVWTEGVYKLSVDGATTVGMPLYKAAASNDLTPTATGNTLFGYALEVKGAGTAPVRVKLAKV